MPPIFLSASVPVSGRGDYYRTADVMLIRSAIRALVTVAIGRRLIVWGGHPAITPMIWTTAEDLGVSYSQCVHLFQSRYCKEMFPEENKHFKNVTYVDTVENDRTASLAKMRSEMLKKYDYFAAVFIGGMEGVFEELAIFQEFHPNAAIIPVASAGGAALEIANQLRLESASATNSIDYVGFFHSCLKIEPDEKRQPIRD